MTHIGTLEVSFRFLKYALKFPENSKILKVRQSWEQERSGVFELLIESPEFNFTSEDAPIPLIQATATAEFCTADEIVHIKEVKLENS